MSSNIYDPYVEAKEKKLAVMFINFEKINSFLTKSVIYLRDSMNRIEKRCCLTYEIVHYTRSHFKDGELCTGHSKEEEEIIKQEAAKKLVPVKRLYELMESCHTIEEIAEELEVTTEVLNDYFRYCKSKPAEVYITI